MWLSWIWPPCRPWPWPRRGGGPMAAGAGRWAGAVAFTTEASLVAALYAVWQWVGDLPARKALHAVDHGLWVWHAEQRLHLADELHSLQRMVLHHPLLVQAANGFYAIVHVPALGSSGSGSSSAITTATVLPVRWRNARLRLLRHPPVPGRAAAPDPEPPLRRHRPPLPPVRCTARFGAGMSARELRPCRRCTSDGPVSGDRGHGHHVGTVAGAGGSSSHPVLTTLSRGGHRQPLLADGIVAAGLLGLSMLAVQTVDRFRYGADGPGPGDGDGGGGTGAWRPWPGRTGWPRRLSAATRGGRAARERPRPGHRQPPFVLAAALPAAGGPLRSWGGPDPVVPREVLRRPRLSPADLVGAGRAVLLSPSCARPPWTPATCSPTRRQYHLAETRYSMKRGEPVTPSEPIVEVRDVRKHFTTPEGAPLPVLEDINLQLREGEIVALLGKSGSGKSTLLRCIAGLIAPSGGTVLVPGDAAQRRQPGCGHGVPELRPAALADGEGQRRDGPRGAGRGARERTVRAEKVIDIIGLDGFESAATRKSCRAACASGSGSPGRWSSNPTPC